MINGWVLGHASLEAQHTSDVVGHITSLKPDDGSSKGPSFVPCSAIAVVTNRERIPVWVQISANVYEEVGSNWVLVETLPEEDMVLPSRETDNISAYRLLQLPPGEYKITSKLFTFDPAYSFPFGLMMLDETENHFTVE